VSEERAGEGRARLFVALEVPREVRNALGRWRSASLSGVAGLRPLPDDHLHITLCFLGWLAADQVEGVIQACNRLLPSDPPTVRLGEPRWLPSRRPRVLAVSLDDDRGRLIVLQAELSRLLESGGWYQPEGRPYLPHVTVARARRRSSVRPSPLSAPPALSFSASRLTLFRSHLSPGGASYEALSGVTLSTA
jgi:2'-5' RNA ligase